MPARLEIHPSITVHELKQLAREYGNLVRFDLTDGITGQRVAVIVAIAEKAEEVLSLPIGIDIDPVSWASDRMGGGNA